MQRMSRRLEKNNLGFSTCFLGQFKLHFVQYIILDISYLYIKQICGFKMPEKLTQNI